MHWARFCVVCVEMCFCFLSRQLSYQDQGVARAIVGWVWFK